MTNLCPACESGTLVARVADKIIKFEGEPLRVKNLHYSECPICGEKVVLPAQSKRNEVVYADAKKGQLGLWSCGKIEAFRREWQLTQGSASKIFGGGANAFSKYERGEVIHARSMDLLMRVFDQVEEARVWLSDYAGFALPKIPAWETVESAPAPKKRANASAVMQSYGAFKANAANGDHWMTCDATHGS